MTSQTARAERERQSYDAGLQRQNYKRLFDPARRFYRKKRVKIISDLLRTNPHNNMLEIGCDAAIRYVEPSGFQPETLICTNISETELKSGIKAAAGARLRPIFQLMDAHNLEFDDESFDIVFGQSILHHLELERALNEIYRVLRPEGLMFFMEPFDMNPLGRLVRFATPKARTIDEKPFRKEDIVCIEKYFQCKTYYEQLLSVPFGVIAGILPNQLGNGALQLAFTADEWIAQKFPKLGPYFRTGLFIGRKRSLK